MRSARLAVRPDSDAACKSNAIAPGATCLIECMIWQLSISHAPQRRVIESASFGLSHTFGACQETRCWGMGLVFVQICLLNSSARQTPRVCVRVCGRSSPPPPGDLGFQTVDILESTVFCLNPDTLPTQFPTHFCGGFPGSWYFYRVENFHRFDCAGLGRHIAVSRK